MRSACVFVFDAYGTLLDVHSAVSKFASALGVDAIRFSETWRAKQLEYTWTLSLMRRYEPFWTLTERALDFAFAKFPAADRALRTALLDAYRTLDAYPEAAPTLKLLRASGAKLAVLSNGNRAMLEAAFRSAKLDTCLDRLLSVEDVGVFKTDPRAYQRVLDEFRCARGDVTFVSSNRWDVAGAVSFGFESVWINRTQQPDEYAEFAPIKVLADLTALALPPIPNSN
jgi:2-haloacid dehalogenase